MLNPDEKQLRSYRVDPALPLPPAHQILRMVLLEEFACRAFLQRTQDAFGVRDVIAYALKRNTVRLQTLVRLTQRHGVPVPLDTYAAAMTPAPGWRSTCERILQGELQRAGLYAQWIGFADFPAMTQQFQKAYQEASGDLIPRFRDALAQAYASEQMHARRGVPPYETDMQHGRVADFLEKSFHILASQHEAWGLLGPMVRQMPAPLLIGALSGGLVTYALRRNMQKQNQQQGENT